jgi:hypothetical protein
MENVGENVGDRAATGQASVDDVTNRRCQRRMPNAAMTAGGKGDVAHAEKSGSESFDFHAILTPLFPSPDPFVSSPMPKCETVWVLGSSLAS